MKKEIMSINGWGLVYHGGLQRKQYLVRGTWHRKSKHIIKEKMANSMFIEAKYLKFYNLLNWDRLI